MTTTRTSSCGQTNLIKLGIRGKPGAAIGSAPMVAATSITTVPGATTPKKNNNNSSSNNHHNNTSWNQRRGQGAWHRETIGSWANNGRRGNVG
eukprot:CAMPEP_0206455394 /NCGR_PEP_ID=MMETSP0324_2-20121206/21725_1 /ASSEMBLY_ACC=CAM_ASM_000836 /TAXON_ID=2866 /ORGANISM="Crypthecodinium cohnii, Strain Seligo" /LENGTH=92 /DNA_ID=CAMNT_0053926087 /DNA_START=52 /DNA_END=327 /DNA_ORIENTATION=+